MSNRKVNKTLTVDAEALGVLCTLIILGVILFFIPMICIWAVNTLFALSIAQTWTNWFAMLMLFLLFGRGGSSSGK